MSVSDLESTQGNNHKTSCSTFCDVWFLYFHSCYACYLGRLLYAHQFRNCRNNLSIFFLTSYHILEVQSLLQSVEDPDYEVSMKLKQSPLEAKFAIHAVIDSLYFVPHISHIFSSKNSWFDLKVTPSWHFGISHHYLVENVLIVTVKG